MGKLMLTPAHGITDITDMDTMDITADITDITDTLITDITVDAETTKEHLYHALANKKQYDNYLGLTGCTNPNKFFLMRLTLKTHCAGTLGRLQKLIKIVAFFL